MKYLPHLIFTLLICGPLSASAATIADVRYLTVGLTHPDYIPVDCIVSCGTYSNVVSPYFFFNTNSPAGFPLGRSWLYGNAGEVITPTIVQQATVMRYTPSSTYTSFGTTYNIPYSPQPFSGAEAEAALAQAFANGSITVPASYAAAPLNYVLSVGAPIRFGSVWGNAIPVDTRVVTIRWLYVPGVKSAMTNEFSGQVLTTPIAEGEATRSVAHTNLFEPVAEALATVFKTRTAHATIGGLDGGYPPLPEFNGSTAEGTFYLFAANVAVPTATLAANPTAVIQGNASLLTWSSTGATSCTGTNFDTGGATSGSVSVVPSATTAYSVTCTGAGGTSAPANATVTVTPLAVPSGLSATCNAAGTSVTLSWNAVSGATFYYPRLVYPGAQCASYGWQLWPGDNATCIPNPDVWVPTTVNSFPVNPGQTYSWWVHSANGGAISGAASGGFTCNNSLPVCSNGIDDDGDGAADYPADSGCTGAADTTESPNPPPPLSADLSATPTSVISGQPALLRWSSNADSCSGTGFNTGGAANNSVGVSTGPLSLANCPTGTCSYQATCTRTIAKGEGASLAQGGEPTVAGTESISDTATVTVITPTADITATPDRVNSGSASSLTWTSSLATACTVTGTNGFSQSALSGTNVPTGAITAQTTFSISCDSGAATDSVIVSIVPRFEEF